MSPNYIIVIEVDNKRAALAYLTGMRHLDAAWPQLLAGATDADKAESDEHEALMLKYKAEMEEWEQMKANQGPPAIPRFYAFSWSAKPIPPANPVRPEPIRPYCFPRTTAVARLYKIRRDLRHMVNVSTAAVAPFRITEWALETMLKWESGQHVQDLVDRYILEKP